jgi:hypothetical protein
MLKREITDGSLGRLYCSFRGSIHMFAWIGSEEIPLGLISKSLSEPVTGKTSLV